MKEREVWIRLGIKFEGGFWRSSFTISFPLPFWWYNVRLVYISQPQNTFPGIILYVTKGECDEGWLPYKCMSTIDVIYHGNDAIITWITWKIYKLYLYTCTLLSMAIIVFLQFDMSFHTLRMNNKKETIYFKTGIIIKNFFLFLQDEPWIILTFDIFYVQSAFF